MSAILALLFLAAGGGSDRNPEGFSFERSPEADWARRLDAPSPDEADRDDPAQDEDAKPRQTEPPPGAPSGPSQSLIDLGWLELYPRAGLAIFSSRYHINASPCVEIEARAPIPWLSPSSNPDGDYFGAFAQLNVAEIKRTIQPKLAKASGLMASIALGMDYTVYRDDLWLLMVRLGFQYTNYGGVTDLKDGGQAVGGLTGGISLTRSIMLTLTPEIVYAKTGDYILMGLLGVAIEF